MEITGHTIIMATKDNDEVMAKFYIDTLGFTKNEFGGYELGNLHIYFDRHSDASVKSKEPFRVMITMTVDNLEKTTAELKSKGVKFVRELGKEEWGGMFSTFEDPDGNYLQIFELPSGH